MKKLFIILIALTLLLTSCGPIGDEALTKLPDLISRAEVLNEYIWGLGPEVEDYTESEISSGSAKYVRVAASAKFTTLPALTEEILQVFSTSYCENIIEIAVSGSEEVASRYGEDTSDGRLTFNVTSRGFELRTKLDPSKAVVKSIGFNRVEIDVPCTFDGIDDGMYTVALVLENGMWKLDSPTY